MGLTGRFDITDGSRGGGESCKGEEAGVTYSSEELRRAAGGYCEGFIEGCTTRHPNTRCGLYKSGGCGGYKSFWAEFDLEKLADESSGSIKLLREEGFLLAGRVRR